MTSDVKFPNTLKINMGDMVTILGNILDNAIEASEKLKEGRYKAVFDRISDLKSRVSERIKDEKDGM